MVGKRQQRMELDYTDLPLHVTPAVSVNGKYVQKDLLTEEEVEAQELKQLQVGK